jgi:hypothetical protein
LNEKTTKSRPAWPDRGGFREHVDAREDVAEAIANSLCYATAEEPLSRAE